MVLLTVPLGTSSTDYSVFTFTTILQTRKLSSEFAGFGNTINTCLVFRACCSKSAKVGQSLFKSGVVIKISAEDCDDPLTIKRNHHSCLVGTHFMGACRTGTTCMEIAWS